MDVKHQPPLPGWAEFTIMMECTSESNHCQSICTLSSVGGRWEKGNREEIWKREGGEEGGDGRHVWHEEDWSLEEGIVKK
jgi:hypothetical protein